MYGTILAQHLALQKMPKVIQNLQPQLVAAALGEPLPHRGVGRWHPHPPARGNPTTAQPVPWEPRATPLHHGTVQTKPQLLLFSCSRLKCSVMSLEVVTLKPQACPSCRRSHWGERAGLRDPARGCGGLWGPACPLIPVPCNSLSPEGHHHLPANGHQVPLPLQPPGPLQHIPGSGRAVFSTTPLFLSFRPHASSQCTTSLESTTTSSQSQPLNQL